MRECIDEGMLQSYFDGELSRKLADNVAAHLASCVDCTQAAGELESESLLLSEALKSEFAGSVPSERLRHRLDAAIAGLQVVQPARTSEVARAAGTPAIPVVRGWLQSLGELFTLSPQRAFAYSGLVAVILFATIIGGIYWRHPGKGTDNKNNDVAVATPSSTATPSPVATNVEPKDTPAVAEHAPKALPKKRIISHPASREGEIANHVKLLPGERSYLKTIASLDATIKAENNRQMKASLQVEYERNLAMVDQAIAATRTAAKADPNDPDAADFMFAAYQSKIDLLNQVADSRLANRQH
jgi:hypothetical protein